MRVSSLYLKTIRSCLRHMDDMGGYESRQVSPTQSHRRKWPTRRTQHIEIPQIQHADKVAGESVAVQRQISPRTKAPEHQQDDRSGGNADKDVQSEAINQIQLVRREECGKHLPRACRFGLKMHSRQNLARPMCFGPSLQSRTSSEFSRSLGLAHEIIGVKVP